MILNFLIILSNVLFISDSTASLLEVEKQCVPTATVTGPCHDCVCSAEGVFHCKRRRCYAVNLNKGRPKENCQAKHVYREDTNFCTCSDDGAWRSDNCQERFRFLLPKTSRLHYELRTNVVCIPNVLYIIDCNVCRCESTGFIDVAACTNRFCSPGHKADACKTGDVLRTKDEICACSDISFYIDRLCISVNSRPVQKVGDKKLAKLIDVGHSWRRVQDLINDICDTEVVYTVDCNKCVCTEGHLACTTKTCTVKNKIALRGEKSKKKKDELQSLPIVHSLDDSCNPGESYRYKCNKCYCTSEGLSCPKMMCLEDYVLDEDTIGGALSFN